MSQRQSEQSILRYMNMAVREAEKARGTCSPNPFVGAVIVKDDQVIAKGHTQSYGSDHAEVDALKKAGDKARGADLYVTLEPCSHWGKTPPCTDAVIKAGIKRVFFGLRDPNPLVNPDPSTLGPGIISMREAGIEVSWGYLEENISRQLEYFLCRVRKQRPFVVIKCALSLDGRYAAADGSSRWISAPASRALTHRMRQQTDVMLVGISTVLQDDPELTVRLPKTKRQPLRAVLDSHLDIPLDCKLVRSINIAPLLLFHSKALGPAAKAKAKKLQQLGVELAAVAADQDQLDLRQVLQVLHQNGHYSVMLESGGSLASGFVRSRLADKLILFYGPKLLGGANSAFTDLGISSICDAIQMDVTSTRRLGPDLMVTAYPRY